MAYTLISNATVGFITPLEDLNLPPHIYQIIKGMWDTGFMMHSVKLIELVAGIMFLFNFKIPVVLIALAPVVFNIYGIHIFLFNAFFTKGLMMILICLYFGFKYKKQFIQLTD